MFKSVTTARYLHLRLLACALLALPITYFVIAYLYLGSWHRQTLLWNTLVHENGRLTLAGSLFYFDHFLGCVPMIVVFSLCTAGGIAMKGGVPPTPETSRAATIAAILLGTSALMALAAFIASVQTAGWERTLDYALQRVERDGVLSKGGNWNQQQLSNLPIALGAIGLSGSFAVGAIGAGSKRNVNLAKWGWIYIGLAVALT
ncbi:MAG: hypothetical protein ACREAB_19700, partial [Blastocatellia bacterium]